jgi:hypothetical protein
VLTPQVPNHDDETVTISDVADAATFCAMSDFDEESSAESTTESNDDSSSDEDDGGLLSDSFIAEQINQRRLSAVSNHARVRRVVDQVRARQLEIDRFLEPHTESSSAHQVQRGIFEDQVARHVARRVAIDRLLEPDTSSSSDGEGPSKRPRKK